MAWRCSMRGGLAAVAIVAAVSVGLAQEPPGGGVLAVLPVENLAADLPPIEDLRLRVQEAVAARGLAVVAIPEVDATLATARARWTGGVDLALAKGLRERDGANAVLVTTVEHWEPGEAPRLALSARLVSLGEGEPRSVWAVSVHVAGDDAPGFLGRGLVSDIDVLAERAVARIADEMAAFLATGAPPPVEDPRPERRFRPRSLSVGETPATTPGGRPRVAVVSFRNQSVHPHAGEIAALETSNALVRSGAYEVVERGLVRDAQLETRLIQEGGISLAQADVLRALLEADVVITGSVSEYRDRYPPIVDFTAYAVDTRRQRVWWLSRARGEGDNRVIFFGLGAVRTAAGLTRELVRALLEQVDSESE